MQETDDEGRQLARLLLRVVRAVKGDRLPITVSKGRKGRFRIARKKRKIS